MQISIDQLMNGKATRIGKRAYLPTAAYVEPFIERMSKFTKDFIVEVELPKQVTRTVDGDVNADDITYNRVLIQAVMPESCSFDNHDEVIGIHHQKGHDTGQKVRQVAEHAAHNLHQALFIDSGNVDLHRDGIEGIEDRDTQGERQKVDEVVAAGAADVTPSEFTEHRSPHRPSWQRPP